MLMRDPIVALPAPSVSPCALLGVAGGASSPEQLGHCHWSPHPCGTLCQEEIFPIPLRSPSATV